MKQMQILPAFIALWCMLTLPSQAAVKGEGCAPNREAALRYALADLSSQIQVRVDSEYYRAAVQSGGKNSEYTSHKVRLTSDLPIYAYRAEYSGECASVAFDETKAPSAYAGKAEELARGIDALTGASAGEESDGEKNERLLKAAALYDEYEKVAAVAAFLNVPVRPPEMKKEEVLREITRMRHVSGDIPQIAANILSQIPHKALYAYPPALYGSVAVTPFSAALQSHLSTGKVDPRSAPYRLFCFYDPDTRGENFLLNCQVKDRAGSVERSVTTVVSKEVCRRVSCEASDGMKALEKAFSYLSEGKGGFRGYFYTDWGADALVLSAGDLVRLYARVSGEGEMFLLSLFPPGDTIYLLPFLDGQPIRKVRKEDTNKEMELARLKVTPPFGEESLILVAVKGGVENILPAYRKNERTGVWEIEGRPPEVLAEIRGKLAGKAHFESELFFLTKAGEER